MAVYRVDFHLNMGNTVVQMTQLVDVPDEQGPPCLGDAHIQVTGEDLTSIQKLSSEGREVIAFQTPDSDNRRREAVMATRKKETQNG